MAPPDMDLTEGVGESSSPPRSFAHTSGGLYDLTNDVYNRLVESGHPKAVLNPDLRDLLESHFSRLPPSYALDVNMDKVEDVLLHHDLLAQAMFPDKRPAFHVRFLEHIGIKPGESEDLETCNAPHQRQFHDDDDEEPTTPGKRSREAAPDFEPCSKLEDLNLDVRKNEDADTFPKRQELTVPIHEVIFSTADKPKLLSQLSALLSDIGLNIREAHVFSTSDGYSLDVFVVDGWQNEDTDGLREAMVKAIERSEGSWSGSTHSQSVIEKALAAQASGDMEIDRRLLKIGEKITSGSFGDLFRGTYLGQDVAIKILRSEHINEAPANEFAQEVEILREVHHRNVVRFFGACTKSPQLCILTEYMPGGSLYHYLQNHPDGLKLIQLLKFALDISKGMEYLHQNNIIHRDLKTANLLMDGENVVKVADFGIARFQSQGGVMTAETGTYRWMAPEIINHQPYDQKADVFSFAIVIWEMMTAKVVLYGAAQKLKIGLLFCLSIDVQGIERALHCSFHLQVPYGSMTPLQAALGVRQGLRPEVPPDMNPKLAELMRRCWETDPTKRPPFTEIRVELESILQEVQSSEASSSSS